MVIEQKLDIKPLSVNKAWQGRRFKTDTYKSFEKEMLLKLKPKGLKKFDSISVFLTYGFSSRNSDIDNPTKLVLDILCKKYGFDDRYIELLNIKKEIVKIGNEFIDFKIEFKPNDKRSNKRTIKTL